MCQQPFLYCIFHLCKLVLYPCICMYIDCNLLNNTYILILNSVYSGCKYANTCN